jgi:hypothetical protein
MVCYHYIPISPWFGVDPLQLNLLGLNRWAWSAFMLLPHDDITSLG